MENCYIKDASDFLRLEAELGADAKLLESSLLKNRRATERAALKGDDEFAWAAVGYTIHNMNCLFENYFPRIAKFFEYGLDPAAWHSQLVGRMTLEIPGLRPALFDQVLDTRIDEFRSLRPWTISRSKSEKKLMGSSRTDKEPRCANPSFAAHRG
jgi:hypothetical protein